MSEQVSKAYCELKIAIKDFELTFIKLMAILTIAQIIIVLIVLIVFFK